MSNFNTEEFVSLIFQWNEGKGQVLAAFVVLYLSEVV